MSLTQTADAKTSTLLEGRRNENYLRHPRQRQLLNKGNDKSQELHYPNRDYFGCPTGKCQLIECIEGYANATTIAATLSTSQARVELGWMYVYRSRYMCAVEMKGQERNGCTEMVKCVSGVCVKDRAEGD